MRAHSETLRIFAYVREYLHIFANIREYSSNIVEYSRRIFANIREYSSNIREYMCGFDEY